MGWALIRGWVLINFSYLQDGRLFEVGRLIGLSFHNCKSCVYNCDDLVSMCVCDEVYTATTETGATQTM